MHEYNPVKGFRQIFLQVKKETSSCIIKIFLPDILILSRLNIYEIPLHLASYPRIRLITLY